MKGLPPTFYDNAKPMSSDNGYKFPMQVASDMGASSVIRSFNLQSFLPSFLAHVNSTDLCAQADGTTCFQPLPQNNFE